MHMILICICHVDVHVDVWMCGCVGACMYVSMYGIAYIYNMYIYIYAYNIYIYTYLFIHYMYILQVYLCMLCIYVYIYIYVCVCIYIYIMYRCVYTHTIKVSQLSSNISCSISCLHCDPSGLCWSQSGCIVSDTL